MILHHCLPLLEDLITLEKQIEEWHRLMEKKGIQFDSEETLIKVFNLYQAKSQMMFLKGL